MKWFRDPEVTMPRHAGGSLEVFSNTDLKIPQSYLYYTVLME